ncbi:hypothetical protein LIER_38432 [Lithospermum erythrorhizon]|uniref:Uncharacterized protein n=1 Tax=Lithospermum erythrorhizon TaxID=34254 RepID=A0AAV3Q2A3_LITER
MDCSCAAVPSFHVAMARGSQVAFRLSIPETTPGLWISDCSPLLGWLMPHITILVNLIEVKTSGHNCDGGPRTTMLLIWHVATMLLTSFYG